MIRSALPLELAQVTLPPAPMGTVTRFGRVSPALQFRFEAFGFVRPVGQQVRKLAELVLVTVALKTTAAAPVTGTPPAPVTWMSRLSWPVLSVLPAFGLPLPLRVSVMRAGGRLTNSPAVPAMGAAK